MERENNFCEENGEPMAKKIKTEWVKSYSDKALLMMTRMGYEKNKGLGKQNQGRLEPIIAVQQDGRKGLGLKDECQVSLESWDNTTEIINLPENYSWITNNASLEITLDELKDNITLGPPKRTIDDECLYCNSDILNNVLKAKSEFDKLNDSELRRARSRSNPFETIRSSIFLNRAAVKMANIDSMCDYMFTNPRYKDGSSMLQNNELLYFADICAAAKDSADRVSRGGKTAQYYREYRARKKAEREKEELEMIAGGQSRKRNTGTEDQREYRARKKRNVKVHSVIQRLLFHPTQFEEYKREIVTLHIPFHYETELLSESKFLQIYADNENIILERRKEFESNINIEETMRLCEQLYREKELCKKTVKMLWERLLSQFHSMKCTQTLIQTSTMIFA